MRSIFRRARPWGGLVLVLSAPLAPIASASSGELYLTFNQFLQRRADDGTLISQTTVPYPGVPPFGHVARDVAVVHDARVVVVNGTAAPYLSVWDPVSDLWSHVTHPDWDVSGLYYAGGLALLGTRAFAADDAGVSGIFVFDFDDGAVQVIGPSPSGYVDVALGLDDLLYGLRSDGVTVDVFDPSTLATLGLVSLSTKVQAIAVDAAGEVLGASATGNVYRFDASGAQVASFFTGTSQLMDLDLAPDGALVVANFFGLVVQTDAAFGPVQSYYIGVGVPHFQVFADPPPAPPPAGTPASETVRLGVPPNPEAFLPGVTSGPIAGAVWDPVVQDLLRRPVLDFVLLSSVPTNARTPFGTLLCVPHSVRFGVPGRPFELAIPDDPSVVGLELTAQGGSLGWRGLTLANALDIVIGTF